MAAAFSARDRPREAAHTGRATHRRKSDVAEFCLYRKPPRSRARAARERDRRVGPLPGRSDLLQPVADRLVGQKTAERQQRIGAQVARMRAHIEQAGIAAAPAHLELRIGIVPARAHRTHPLARQGPTVLRMEDAEHAADLLEFRAGAVRELRDHP